MKVPSRPFVTFKRVRGIPWVQGLGFIMGGNMQGKRGVSWFGIIDDFQKLLVGGVA